VIAGHYTNGGPSTINVHQLINRKHVEIRGCWGSEVGHFQRALRLLAQYSDEVPWEKIGARVYGLDDINAALRDVESMRIPKALVRP
jgi:L-iditol 2-dehydrogenase